MRNIALTNFESYTIGNLQKCDAFCMDRDSVFIYNDGKVTKFTNSGKSSFEILNLTNNLYPVNDANELPSVVHQCYSFEKRSIFLFMHNGDIVLIELNDNTCNSDVVGSVDGGIKAVSLSPVSEILAIVTGNDNVIVMNNEFDPLSEVPLHGGGFGAQQFTTVGWGKKETQFRGSEGKYKSNDSNSTQESKVVPSDYSVRISWRGDAEYFAVSCINPENEERYLRIFDKDGVLQYTGEQITGLEHSLHWRPSGNLIASTQRLQNKHNVCFFEKNGLKHGDFTLPYKPHEVVVKELMWNEDSRLLALLIEHIADDTNVDSQVRNVGERSILIYSTNNYHWYCKYGIACDDNRNIVMQWDQYDCNLLHVLSVKSDLLHHAKYKWMWTVNRSRVNSVEDESLVAVIDNNKLLLTSFKNGILPPPLCTYSLEMPCQINQVEFAQFDALPNDLCVQLSNGLIFFYKFDPCNEKPDEVPYKLIGKLNLGPRHVYSMCWVSQGTLAFCEVDRENAFISTLNIIDMNHVNENITFSEKKHVIKSRAAMLKHHSGSIILYDNMGRTYSFDRDTEEFSQLHPQRERTFIESEVARGKDGSLIIFGRDNTNKFFINGSVASNNITSFHIHNDFLLLTSLKNRLVCVRMDSGVDALSKEFNQNEMSTRRIEIGARLITSTLKGSKVVMQLPRGNLECVQPRALSLSIIGNYLDDLKYHEAFSLMRQQRINLNLLYDHNPYLFRDNVNLFIEQIQDPSWISLFLSELMNEDVTRTMYSVIYKNAKLRPTGQSDGSKIKTVCEFLERVLQAVEKPDRYVLPLLTTYIKRGETVYIEEALRKVKKLKEAENNREKLGVSFDEAVRYMLYLIDVEDLYKVALGMYDFDLVLLVLTKSQKDPKEYLPFLNDCRKLEVNYQRYTIDKYLERYEKALKHLLHCGGDEYFLECLTFIKTHKLYKEALKYVPHTTDRYKQICAIYAHDLMASQLYEEAGIMYSNSGSYYDAYIAFGKSGNWREVISCTRKLELPNQELNEIYLNLAGELVEGKKYKDASVVYLDYLKNVELAVVSLCLGKMFAESFRIAQLHNREDVVQAHIKPAILECHRMTKMQLLSFGEQLGNQRKRLSVVREQKSRESEEGKYCNSVSEQDAFSDASTVTTRSYAGSRTTNRTFRSAKNKRKQERKMLSLREGSQYEDLALIASLHNIVSNCVEMRHEVRELNACLIKIQEDSLAEELQTILGKLLKQVDDSTPEIWTSDVQLPNRSTTYGPESTSNSIAASFAQSPNLNSTHLINPRLLIPPETQTNFKWKLDILND